MANSALGTTTASNPAPATDPNKAANQAIKQQNAQNQQAWQSQQPMVDSNNQSNFIPLNKNAYNVQNQQMNTTMGNDAVLQKLQGTALNQQQPSSMSLLQQKTNDLLTNPNQNYNPVAYNQMTMEQFDRDQSKAMEAARQQLGDTSQSGELKNEFLKNLLTVNQNRSDKKTQLDYDAMKKEQDNLLAALGQGRSQAQLESDTTAANINNLVSARGAAEGERAQTQQQADDLQKMAQQNVYDVALKTMDTDSQKMLTELKGKIDSGLQISAQDHESAEAILDRQQAIALQKGDRDTAMAIETLKGEIQAKAQESSQNWSNTQRELTQIYNTSERLDTQNFDKNMKTLDAQIAETKAQSDFGRTKEGLLLQSQIDEAKAGADQNRVVELENLKAANSEQYAKSRAAETEQLEQKKFDYQWLMQNNELSHDEKMVNLQADLEEAKAQKDQGRVVELTNLQASLEVSKMKEQYGYDTAMTNLKAQISEAEASKNFEYSTALKQQEIDANAEESAKDRAIELSELALKQDAATFQTYNDMKATDPEGAAKYLKTELAKKGITYDPVDAYEQAKQSINTDFKLAQDQWLQTHDSLEGFNDFYNEAMFSGTTQQDVIDQAVTGQLTYQQIKSDPQKLKAAKESATPWTMEQKETGTGTNSVKRFQSVPEKNVPFTVDGKTVMRIGDVLTKKVIGDDDLEYFMTIDLDSGASYKVSTHQ